MRRAGLALFLFLMGLLIPVKGSRAAEGDGQNPGIADLTVESRVEETVSTPGMGSRFTFDLSAAAGFR